MRELNTRFFSDCLSTDKMAAGRSRFASLNDEEFDDLLNRKDSENTQKATKKAVTVFREYLSAKNRPEDFENFEKDELGNVLSRFYVEARIQTMKIHYRLTQPCLVRLYQQYLPRTLAQLLLAAQHVVQCKFSLCNSRVHFRYIIVMSPLITTII